VNLLEQVTEAVRKADLPVVADEQDAGYVIQQWGPSTVSVRWQREGDHSLTDALQPRELGPCLEALSAAGIKAAAEYAHDHRWRVIVRASQRPAGSV
jgi:hypothetical protein